MSHAEDFAQAEMERLREERNERIRALRRCQCRRPILGRRYLGCPSCSRCGKLIHDLRTNASR